MLNRPASLLLALSACLLTVAAPTSRAGRVYKTVDAQGITHYSDRAPEGAPDSAVETLHFRAETQNFVQLRVDGDGELRNAHARNQLFGPIEVELIFTSQRNITASPQLPLRRVIDGQRETTLAELHIGDSRQAARFELGLSAVPGDSSARPQDVLYAFPLKLIGNGRVDQGFGGTFSHNEPQSRYAIDIGADEGTEVLAARDGVVMQVEDDFEGAGLDREKFADRANYVRILHTDGSMGLYAHLSPESVLVRGGQHVSAGQSIARSGNTGFSTGPHLHFAVQVNRGMSLESIPFRMRDATGELDLVDHRK